MEIADIVQKFTNNPIDETLTKFDSESKAHLELLRTLFTIFYGLAMLVFIAFSMTSDININIQSTILGNYKFLFTTSRVVLLSSFVVVLFLIYQFECLCTMYVKDQIEKNRLKIVYGTVIGLNRVKK